MALHEDGGLIVSGRDILHVRPDGEQVVLLDRLPGFTAYNDIGTLGDGTLLCGALRFNPMQGEPPQAGALMALRPGDDHPDTTELPLVMWPNGIACAPDGETFYVADFDDGRIWRDAHEPWAKSPSGDADGMAVDEEGGVWVALGGGAAIGKFVDGELVERIDVPGADFVSSLCFGGNPLDDLYVTTRTSVLKTRVDATGLPVPVARV
jgi:gluconolactonase